MFSKKKEGEQSEFEWAVGCQKFKVAVYLPIFSVCVCEMTLVFGTGPSSAGDVCCKTVSEKVPPSVRVKCR